MVHALWPLFDLRLRTDRLELRLPTDDELAMLCLIAMEGIHDPGEMPFGYPWTEVPSPRFEREFAQFHWGLRARRQPNDWNLALMVVADGRPIGSQDIGARHLGAEVAETDALLDNAASAGVSRAVGYRENGLGRLAPQGRARDTQRFRLTAAEWRDRPHPTVAVEGLERCLELFGVPA